MTENENVNKPEHVHKEGYIKPGNEEYLSYYNYQDEWKSTKAVGTIGALNSSPGPAIVSLPSTIGDQLHDPRKFKAPAFKFGEKDSRQSFSIGPGPAKYNVRKITNKGGDICHAPILGEKIEGLVTFRSPGPAAYNTEESSRHVFRKSPSYTMRPKTQPLKGFIPPEPTKYTLPDTLGTGRSPFKRSPAYTMSQRLDKTGIYQQNPGPAAHELPSLNVTKTKAPAFSMGIKDKDSKVGPVSPGPISNYYHMVKFNKPSTPRYSFGIRHTPFKAFQRFAAEN